MLVLNLDLVLQIKLLLVVLQILRQKASVGVAVTSLEMPITRAVSNTSVNAIRVTVSFTNIQKVQDNGEIAGASAGGEG
jgi:predicted phage tail protein